MKVVYPQVVVVCMDSNGAPTMYTCAPECTPEEVADGDHLRKARENAAEDFYEEPMIAFDATDPAALQIMSGDVAKWLRPAKQEGMREVLVTMALDVSAYATVVVSVPANADLAEYMETNGRKLASNLVFAPEWDTGEGLRVVHIDDAETREPLASDIELERSPRDVALARANQKLEKNAGIIRSYWQALEANLPDHILQAFKAMLED